MNTSAKRPDLKNQAPSFQTLVEIMSTLRSPNGCPWDREQTPESLTPYAIEETYELVDAIENGNLDEYIEELGDVLLQVVFHAQIGKEKNKFSIEDVLNSICTKLLTRHPHVFGDVKVKNSKEVLKNWNKIKKLEKKSFDQNKFSIPKNLPALQKASKIGSKTKKERFDWKTAKQVMVKMEEEIKELGTAKTKKEREHELGDILFTVAQIARHMDIDPEQALRKCNARFEKRFFKMKELAKKKNLNFNTLPSVRLEKLWQEAKKASR